MILLEGPDRCGKSTVAQHLRTLLPGWSYRHHTKPPVPPYEYFTYFLADTHPRVICDRNHWSGYAYGKAYLRGKEMTDHEWRMVELAHLSRGTYVILMTDEPKNIASRWSAEEMYTPDHLEELVGFYDDLLRGHSDPKSHLPSRSFDLTDLVRDGKPTDMLVALAAHAQDLAARASQLLPASLGTGTYAPEFVVLGEAPGSILTPTDRAPSMPWDKGPSSEWLWKALDEIGLEWWKGYYTNASAFTGPEGFANYINTTLHGPKKILCLGKVAEHLATRAKERDLLPKTEVVEAHHPMYVRRFQNAEFVRWTGDLRDLMQEYCGKEVVA